MVMLSAARELAAQARLTGTVRDTTGAPIAGVEVIVSGISRTTTTDRTGAFRLEGLPAGTATVTTRRLGYAAQGTVLRLVNGDNTMPDVVLTVVARELDTVSTREQQLWRERPLLREFEENRKLGMGQFITRAEFAKNQGGFISPMLDQRRGIVVVRGPYAKTWIANKYMPSVGCFELEDYAGGTLSPAFPDPRCNYCYPDVYVDYAKISSRGVAPNVARFSPDQLEAMEIYLGPAETPTRYASGPTSCGAVVLHTRAVDSKPRVVGLRRPDQPTRARFLVNVSAAAGHPGANCVECGIGSAFDAMLGYTLNDRWVLGGRYAKWSGAANGPQSLSLTTANLEWYPHPEPARVKWFMNVGLGVMTVDLRSQPSREVVDGYTGSGMPSTSFGTGVDISMMHRVVLTPFISHSRNFGGDARMNHCISQFPTNAPVSTECFPIRSNPTFTFTQLGTRIGWR